MSYVGKKIIFFCAELKQESIVCEEEKASKNSVPECQMES